MRKFMAPVAAGLLSVLALAGVGLICIAALQGVFDNTTQVAIRTIMLADEIGTANAEMARAQRGVIVAAFAKDAAEAERYRAAFDRNAEAVRKAVVRMGPLARDDQTRRLAAEIAGLSAAWLPQHRELVAQTEAGHLAEANRIRIGVTAPVYGRISEAVQQIAARSRETLRMNQQTKGIWFGGRSLSFLLLALTLLVAGLTAAVFRRTRQDLRSRMRARLITSQSVNWPEPRAKSLVGERKWPKRSA